MMGGRAQAGVALVLALSLHGGAFAVQPMAVGAVASGDQGDALVTLQAADGGLVDLVAAWDAPPQVTKISMPDPVDLAPALTPVLPPAGEAAPSIVQPALTDVLIPSETLPKADVTLPQPAPKPNEKTKPKTEKPATKPKVKAASAGQTAQKATGSGQGGQAGEGGKAKGGTLSKAAQSDLKAGWGASIRARIEKRKRYPAGAKGAAGKVTVRLSVTQSGKLAGVSVTKSSGISALDAAAVKAVQAVGTFPPAPKGLGDASYSFTLPMSFKQP